MADRYWRGGSGTWDATTTTNWSATSGGAGGASAPTSADNVIFDAGSNVGTGAFTVTVAGTSVAPSVCNNFSTGGAGGALDGAMTLSLGATAVLNCYGSLTLPATNFTWTGVFGANLIFRATTTGKTVTTNGVTLTAQLVTFNGVGGEWTLGSAITTTTNGFLVSAGSLVTANFNMTGTSLATSGEDSKTISLGSSTLTLSGTAAVNTTAINLTFNAGTSTINCSGANPTFNGGGQTFYNVNFTSDIFGTTTINAANTFNNLTQTSRSFTGNRVFALDANQTVSGTLTFGTANTTIRRVQVVSSTIGTQRTITLNGTLATLSDCDFRDIATAGSAGTWTGTRLGNGLNNSGITFPAAKDVYWNSTVSGSWSGNFWALSSGGAVNVNNFPLAQDKVIIENTGLNTGATVTIDIIGVFIGELDASGRSLAMTLASGSASFSIYKNIALSSSVTMTGNGVWTVSGQGTTQTLTISNSFVPRLTIDSPGGTFRLTSNTVVSAGTGTTLTRGTLDLNNFNLNSNRLTSDNSNVRTIAFGTGVINATGTGATIVSMSNNQNLTCTGSKIVNLTYSGTPSFRLVQIGSTVAYDYTNPNSLLNINITAGTDQVGLDAVINSVDTTGFSGTFIPTQVVLSGNLILSADILLEPQGVYNFAGIGGTQQITTNGQVFEDCSIFFFNAVPNNNSIFAFQDALTMTEVNTNYSSIGLDSGTLQFKAGTVNTVQNFYTLDQSGVQQKYLQSTTSGVQATLFQASGTVNVTNLTIRDSNATGGATFYAATNLQNIDAGNNTGWNFDEIPPLYRLTNTGIFYTNSAELDEVTLTQIRMSKTTFFAADLDEVTTIPVAMRQLATGTVIVQTEFDEVTTVT
jgi:hypothetical protein